MPTRFNDLCHLILIEFSQYFCTNSTCIRLDVSESGLVALVRLCNGDMRKALNILQVLICVTVRIMH